MPQKLMEPPEVAPEEPPAKRSRPGARKQPRPHTVTHHKPRPIDWHFWVTSAIALLATVAEFLRGCADPNKH